MENDDILCKVVAAEKEIRQMVEEEEQRSRTLIEEARRKAEDAVVREGERLKASLAAAVGKARREAEEEATERTASARLKTERLEGISDELLRGIMMSRLPSILPRAVAGGCRDREDV